VISNVETGNSRDQLDELFRQCELRGVLDLGRGWEAPDNARVKEGYYSADPALEWPAFEAGPNKDGTLPTVREVLTAFFKGRPAYRWRIDAGGFVRVEPSDKRKRMDWLLNRKFPKPLVSDVDEEKRWVIRGYDEVDDAVLAAFPEWKGQDVWFDLSWRTSGLMPPLNVYPPRKTSVASIDEFLQLWLAERPNGYVVVDGGSYWKGFGNDVEVLELPPFRRHATTEELVNALKAGASEPKGYKSPLTFAYDCDREIQRRNHFEPDVVFDAILASDIGAELYWPLDDRVGMFYSLDKERFAPFLRVCYAAASERDKSKGRKVEDTPLETFGRADYVRYWKHLARSDDPVLRKHGLSRLKKQTPPEHSGDADRIDAL
jgi:hypothetical protein